MKALAEDEISHYNDRGYLIVNNVLTDDELEALRERTADIANGKVEFPASSVEFEPGADGNRSLATVRKINAAEEDPIFLSHAANTKILDLIERLIGPDLKLFGCQIFMKPPGGVEKPYHQDSPYFTIEPMALVTCWTALDDVTVDNGCLWVVPGSHRLGVFDHSEAWMIGDRQDMRVPRAKIDHNAETPLIMRAGSCSLHHSLLLHGSRPNRTTQSRRGFAAHYMSAQSRWTHATQPQPSYRLLRGREYPGCV
ncbi:MAG: phytanoyl-CoA dioxygenase family protein [Planctomycetes bacterium]|nr:phytanoyl-CoA dioxygenase family protein [Planctomycetota bacterium]